MSVLLKAAWYCPECKRESITALRNPMHPCPKLRGMWAPMLPKGVAAKLELHEREDYVGKELVQRDPEQGRPVMSIVTTRDNGQDTVVFAPTATLRGET